MFKALNGEEPTEEFVKQLTYDFAFLYLAGTDTTANSMMMTIYYCALHPKVLEKVRSEIDKYIKTDADISYEGLKNLTYLDAVIMETLRYYSPTNFMLFR